MSMSYFWCYGRPTVQKDIRARSFLIGHFFRLECLIGGKSFVDLCRHLSSYGIVTSFSKKKQGKR